jgi:prepilin-type N-terminal cleavage/methylation domain-containing protein
MGELMTIAKKNERGFTLIEIIVTLVLVGITAALAGMWIVSVTNGYIFARNNMETTQKAQLAMTRLVKEFKAISAVTAASASSITYTRADVSSGSVTSNVASSGSQVQLNGNTLTDNVSSFSLHYCANVTDIGSNCPTTWSSTSHIIEIELKLTGANNIVSTFTERVTPLNL